MSLHNYESIGLYTCFNIYCIVMYLIYSEVKYKVLQELYKEEMLQLHKVNIPCNTLVTICSCVNMAVMYPTIFVLCF